MTEEIEYKIKVTPWHRFRGDYGWGYSDDSDYEFELSHNSIDELYEAIANDYNNWIVRMEHNASISKIDYDQIENNGIKYSPIYIEVEPYSEEKRNATKAYKEIGEVRDRFIAAKKAAEEKERIRVEAWRKAEKEKQDRLEFERLKKKFNQ